MTENDPALFDYLNSKLRKGEKRRTISLKKYEHDLALITTSLREVISLPENVYGILSFIIFGSWARKDDFTRPTGESDIDLLATSRQVLDGHQFESVRNLVKSRLYKQKNVWLAACMGPEALDRLYREEHQYLKHGFIEVR